MPYCTNCGRRCNDGARFCPSCGTSVTTDIVSPDAAANQPYASYQPYQPYQPIPSRDRSELLSEAVNVRTHFGQYADLYRRIDEVIENSKDHESNPGPGLLVWSIIFTVIGFVFSCFASCNVSNVLITINFFVLGGLLMFFHFLRRSICRREIEEDERNIGEAINALLEHYSSYASCPVCFEYTHPDVLGPACDAILQGRSDSWKEALNLATDFGRNRHVRICTEHLLIAIRYGKYKNVNDAAYNFTPY